MSCFRGYLTVVLTLSWPPAPEMAEQLFRTAEAAVTKFSLQGRQHVYERKCYLQLESETIAKQEAPWSPD